MMLMLAKAVQTDRWWEAQGSVDLDSKSIESVEQIYCKRPNGDKAVGYLLITMKTGTQHKVFELMSSVRNHMCHSCNAHEN